MIIHIIHIRMCIFLICRLKLLFGDILLIYYYLIVMNCSKTISVIVQKSLYSPKRNGWKLFTYKDKGMAYHQYGWILLWTIKFIFCKNDFPNMPQENGFFPLAVWDVLWRVKSFMVQKAFSQTSHLKFFSPAWSLKKTY